VRAILLLFLAYMGTKYMYQQYVGGKAYFGLIAIPLLQTLQFQRKDFRLLKVANAQGNLIYTVIYLMIIAPFSLGFFLTQEYIYLAISVLFAVLIPHTRKSLFDIDKVFVNMGTFLPYKYFEWKTGLRQYGLILTILMVAGMTLSIFQGAVPIVIFFITLNTSVFYLHAESKELLVASASNPKELILSKIKGHLLLFYSLILPLVVLDLIFNHHLWFVLLYVLVISFFTNINAILFKYKFYEQGARFDNNNVLQALNLVFFLVPFLFPLPIILAIISYKKSIKNLSRYFKYGN